MIQALPLRALPLRALPLVVPTQAVPCPEVQVYRGISRSLHFIRRVQERGLDEPVLEFILTFGREYQRCGATHLTVLDKDLPKALRNSPMARKAHDWVVLFAEDDTGLTCYRRKNAVRYLKKKSPRRLSGDQLADGQRPTRRTKGIF